SRPETIPKSSLINHPTNYFHLNQQQQQQQQSTRNREISASSSNVSCFIDGLTILVVIGELFGVG
ncbi:unnamed protein product, partial [Rotaria sp. Silwood1]